MVVPIIANAPLTAGTHPSGVAACRQTTTCD
jgi:hypothetical protein